MPFCTNCGQEVPERAKFCRNCGAATGIDSSAYQERRKVVFAGEVRKCPSCGAELPSMVAVCPSCGYELNSQHIHPIVAKFSEELRVCDQEIADEAMNGLAKKQGGWSSWGGWAKFGWVLLNIYTLCIPLIFYRIRRSRPHTPATTKKAALIENFQIPNEREAIIEVLYFIQGKVDVLSTQGSSEENLYWINLWNTKGKFLREKANILLPGDKFVSDVYSDISQKTQKIKSTVFLKRGAIIAGILIFFLIFYGSGSPSSKQGESLRYNTNPAEIENQIDMAQLLSDKKSKSGFDKSTNQSCELGNMSVSVPSYYGKKNSENSSITLYAETGESVVMLFIQESEDFDTVSHSAGSIINSFVDGVLSSIERGETFENIKLLSSKDTRIAGLPSRIISYTSNHAKLGTVYQRMAVLLDMNDEIGNAYVISLSQSENSEYNYFDDFDKILSSASMKND